MRGHRRPFAALAFAFAFTFAFAFAWAAATASTARASVGPGCEAGAPCGDGDGDGFIACTCAPAGVTCDCDDRDPSVFPGAPEACDDVTDRSCDRVAGFSCGAKKGCLRGACVPECIPLDDFGCGIGNRCESQPSGQRLCAAPDCSSFGCPPASTCDDTKVCVPNCNSGVKCPFGQRCRGAGCVDPCDGVTCNPGAVCRSGQCVASCDCFPGSSGCAPGEVCDRSASVARCVDQACVGVTCPPGLHCAAGTCVDDCAGVACPPKRVCLHVAGDAGMTRGACVDLCSPDPCPRPMVCNWRNGQCDPPMFPEAGLQPLLPDAADDGLFAGGGGVTCNTNGLGPVSTMGAVGAALSFALLVARRIRRASPSPEGHVAARRRSPVQLTVRRQPDPVDLRDDRDREEPDVDGELDPERRR